MPKQPTTKQPTLQEVVDEARAAIAQARAALEKVGLYSLTDEERLHTNGRLRNKEDGAMLSVLDAVDAAPGMFESIASRDHGSDETKVETGPAREAIERWQIIAPLVDDLASLSRDVGDDALAAASLAKDVTVPAYAILRANAKLNDKLRKAGKVALDFYGGFGLKRAKEKKRAANKAKKASKTPA